MRPEPNGLRSFLCTASRCLSVLTLGGAGVSLVVGFAEAFLGDVGVDLGGGQRGMAQKGLDAAEIGSVVEKVGGEGVAQLVGRHVEGDLGLGEVLLEEGVDGAGGETLSEFGQEEGAAGDLGNEFVGGDGVEGDRADGDESFLGSFADDAGGTTKGVDAGDIERGEFGETHAGRVEEFEDGEVAVREPIGCLLFER